MFRRWHPAFGLNGGSPSGSDLVDLYRRRRGCRRCRCLVPDLLERVAVGLGELVGHVFLARRGAVLRSPAFNSSEVEKIIFWPCYRILQYDVVQVRILLLGIGLGSWPTWKTNVIGNVMQLIGTLGCF